MSNKNSSMDIFRVTCKYCELLESKYGNDDNLFLPLGILILKWIDDSRERFNWKTGFNYKSLIDESFSLDIKKELQNVSCDIEVKNKPFQYVFRDLCFTNINYVDDKILKDLVFAYSLYDFKDNDCENKLTNLFMDYFLYYLYERQKQFMVMTPPSITSLISNLFNINSDMNIMDLACGTGTILSQVNSKHRLDSNTIKLYGQDINNKMYLICKINLLLHGVENANIYLKDSLYESILSDNVPKMDLILSDIPLGVKSDLIQLRHKSELNSMVSNFNGKFFSDWLFILRGIAALNNEGKAAFIVSSGTLFRLGEKKIRKKLLLDDLIEAVITLPPNLAKSHNIQLELLIINKSKDISLKNKVLFIDSSSYFHRMDKINTLEQEHIKEICEIYHSHGKRNHDIIKTLIIDFKSIEDNNYILIGSQYTLNSDSYKYLNMRTLGDVSLIKRGLQITKSNGIKLITSDYDLYSGTIDNRVDVHANYDNLPYYIKISDLYDDTINFSDKAINLSQSNIDSYILHPGDILISARGTSIKTAIYTEDMPPCVFSGNIILIRLNHYEYNPYFLKFYLDSKEGKRIISNMQSGASIVSLNPNVLKTLKIPNIDIDKQKKLAHQIIENEQIYKERLQKAKEIYEKNLDNINENIKYLLNY